MRTENSTKIVLFVLCLTVCVGMCRPDVENAKAPSPLIDATAPGSDDTHESGSFFQWAYDKFTHLGGFNKDEEPRLTQTTKYQVEAPAPAPGPAQTGMSPSPGASYYASEAKEKASDAYEKVGKAYQSAKEIITEETNAN